MRLLLTLLLVSTFVSAAPEDKPPFFHVTGGQGQAWLLGSVHVGQPDFYPFPSIIEKAFTNAQVLALEADTHGAKVAQQMQPYLFAKSPLPAPLALQLAEYCQQRKMQCDPSLAPWILSAQLMMAEMAQAGYLPQHGVEHYFLERIGQRPLWELEGMLTQIKIFDGLSVPTQQLMLKEAMEPMDVSPLLEAWRSGDQSALAKLTYDDISAAPEAWEALMVNRNRGMRDTLINWLDSHSDVLFVVVGAGHLVGKESIVSLLEQQGLKVTDCWSGVCP